MTDDPEILDAEPAQARTADAASQGLFDQILAALDKALPGTTVKVEGQAVTLPGRVDGDVTVQLTPLFVIVAFRGARLAVVGGRAPDAIAREVAEKAARFAKDELVVYEAQETAGLLRTVVIAVKDGRLASVIDDGQLPSKAPAHPPRLYSAHGSFSRAPTRDEEKWIARQSGGLTGKLKRKIVAKVFQKVGASLESSLQGRVAEIRADKGDRALGPRDE